MVSTINKYDLTNEMQSLSGGFKTILGENYIIFFIENNLEVECC